MLARLTIDEKATCSTSTIVSADPPRHFDRAAIDALATWKCAAEGARYQAMVEVNFSLKDE